MHRKDIRGHAVQLEQLEQDLAQGNVAHAYLFSGPEHLGKMTIAKWFAEQLLLQGVSEDKRTKTMKDIDHLLHPDLLVLDKLWIDEVSNDWDDIAEYSNVPQIHRSKAPTAKTDTISIDDIRALQDRLHETGTGQYRVCMIRSMERMLDPAANAFLKILEEPPQGLVFLLTTQARSSLLPTIVSRARTLTFRPLGAKELLPLLSGVDEDDMQFILHLAQGAPGLLCLLRDDPDLLRTHRTVQGQARLFWRSQSLRERMQILGDMSSRGNDADRLLLHLALALREQSSLDRHTAVHSLVQYCNALKTNAHRGLLSKEFVLSLPAQNS